MILTLIQAEYIARAIELAASHNAKVTIHIISVDGLLLHVRTMDDGLHIEHDLYSVRIEDRPALQKMNEHFAGYRAMLFSYKEASGLVQDRRSRTVAPKPLISPALQLAMA